ncbi:MAG: toll/interleukin-1 receptor domain-containing protein [Clostridia bacterium]|nr:toll/interleukin-1 receptor domain-containing protein [Clostridia bacterium]
MELGYHVLPKYQNYDLSSLPKILFLSHPEDSPRMGVISGLLSQVLPSAFCFFRNEPSEEEVSLVLSDVSLVAVAVTKRYLTEGSVARDTLVPMAHSLSIPTAFFLLDRFCEAEYARLYGSLEYLSPYHSPKDGLSYEDRVEAFVRSALSDEEERQEIKESFERSLFLSYRKKDRAAALSLMKWLHDLPGLSDVAIWYDDFLVPGEDFNKTIEEALLGADGFLLAVTPHLAEEGNYVMRCEYPAAKKSGKPILPITLAETDPASLQGLYEGLPASLDKNDPTATLTALRGALGDRRDHTPHHRFCVALAYRYGILVERDPERSFAILERLANDGYAPAMLSLAEAHETGIGTRRDRDSAIMWYDAFLESEKKREDWDDGAIDRLLSAYFRRACLYEENEDHREASRAFLSYASAAFCHNREASHAYGYFRAGRCLEAIRHRNAEHLYEESIGLYRKMTLTPFLSRRLAGTLEAMAEVVYQDYRNGQGAFHCSDDDPYREEILKEAALRAIPYAEEAFSLRESVFRADSPLSEWRALFESAERLARYRAVLYDKSEYTPLEHCRALVSHMLDQDSPFHLREFRYRLYLAIIERDLYYGRKTDVLSDLIMLGGKIEREVRILQNTDEWFTLFTLYQKMGELHSAVTGKQDASYHKTACELIASLLLENPTVDNSEHLFLQWIALEGASGILDQGDVSSADAILSVGLSFMNEVNKRYEKVFPELESYAYAIDRRIAAALGDDDRVLSALMRHCSVMMPKPSEDDDGTGWLSYAMMMKYHALECDSAGDYDRELAFMEIRLSAMEEFARRYCPDRFDEETLYTRRELAECYRELERFSDAERVYGECLAFFEKEGSLRPDTFTSYFYMLLSLAELYRKEGRPASGEIFLSLAEERFFHAEDFFGHMPKEIKENKTSFTLRYCHAVIGQCLETGEIPRALSCVRLARTERGSPNDMRTVYQDAATVFLAAEMPEEAITAAEKVISSMKEYDSFREAYNQIVYAEMLLLIARAKKDLCEAEESAEYISRAMTVLEKTASESKSYDSLAAWLRSAAAHRAEYLPNPTLLADCRQVFKRRLTMYPDNPIHRRHYRLVEALETL